MESRKAALTDHVYSITSYKMEGVGSVRNNKATFDLLCQLLTKAKNENTAKGAGEEPGDGYQWDTRRSCGTDGVADCISIGKLEMTLLEPVRQSSLALVVLVPRNLVVPGPFRKFREHSTRFIMFYHVFMYSN